MSAATAAIDTPERSGSVFNYPLAAATVIYQGTLVALDASGNAVPASDAAALRVVGRAEETVDNSDGDAGDLTINAKRGVFKFANSGTAAVDANDKGKVCFVEDDQTVAETSTHKCKAGRVLDVEDDGVWVDTNTPESTQTITALAALTSTNGTMAAAADDAAVKVEGEKIGDDVRAVHATVTDIITALQAVGILK
jgi:FKBP-type peptidyl-prolyl cis-trans isomerase 2